MREERDLLMVFVIVVYMQSDRCVMMGQFDITARSSETHKKNIRTRITIKCLSINCNPTLDMETTRRLFFAHNSSKDQTNASGSSSPEILLYPTKILNRVCRQEQNTIALQQQQ